MHQSRPYGLHGRISSDENAAAVEALVRRLTNIKSAGNLDSLRMVRALPDGGVALATDMGGVLRVVVHHPQEEVAPVESRELAHTDIPMLFSGVVERAVYQAGQGVAIKLTEQACRRLAQYDGQVKASHDLQRFAMDYSERHAEFRPKEGGSLSHSQYVQLRPTWFSGRMASLVQIVGGYGRQDFKKLPDNKIERAKMKLPEKVRLKLEHELGSKRLPGYSGVPPESGQIQFDYKFHETHGVAFDVKKKPWLVRVNQQGVHVMPLPMVPATTTQAFREFVEEKGDEELLWILDRFGGMPSGEGFPVGDGAFEAWRRAGVIIKVCDASNFYTRHMGYSSAMGWSFNERGTEAVNTCYEFDEGDGLQNGRTYKLSLRLGDAKDDGRLPQSWHLEGDDAQVLNQYLSALNRGMGNAPKDRAIRYKLRLVPIGELLSRARGAVGGNTPPEQEISHWDNLEVSPIASHSGNMRMISEGRLWARGFPRKHPQIKFPEPLAKPQQGCLSHDFGQMEGFATVPLDALVRCDTIMHAYFDGNDLKVVKYFLDTRYFAFDGEDDYDECMQVGSWTRTAHNGLLSLHGHFYTSDLDARESFAPKTTVTKTRGTDLGYDHTPFFSYYELFSRGGDIWRHRYFMHDVTSTTSKGTARNVAACVPYFARNAVLYAHRTSVEEEEGYKSRKLYQVRDPNEYHYYTDDFIWAWHGGPRQGNMSNATGSPTPKDGNPVWVSGHSYTPFPCSDFADQGDWMGGLPQDYTWLIHPNRHEWQHAGGGGPPTIQQFYTSHQSGTKSSGELSLCMRSSPWKVNTDPSAGYFTISPSDIGDIFYVDAIQNTAGDSEYTSCSEPNQQSPTLRSWWGFTRMANHKTPHHFIGVHNE